MSLAFIVNIIENTKDYIIVLVFFGVFFSFLEREKPVHKNLPFLKNAFKNEILLAFLNVIVTTPILNFLALFFTLYLLTPFIPYQILSKQILSLPYFLQIFTAILIIDFSIYWRHRFTHYSMWSFHSVHHSAKELTWSTKLRLHPIDVFAATAFDTITMHILGFNGNAIVIATMIVTAFDFFAHTNLNFKFPKPLRYIFASPHSHRWHHANVPEAYNKNYCAVIALYDVIFGTFYHPEELPPAYGLSKGEDKNFKHEKFSNWISYPFIREYKRFKRKRTKS